MPKVKLVGWAGSVPPWAKPWWAKPVVRIVAAAATLSLLIWAAGAAWIFST